VQAVDRVLAAAEQIEAVDRHAAQGERAERPEPQDAQPERERWAADAICWSGARVLGRGQPRRPRHDSSIDERTPRLRQLQRSSRLIDGLALGGRRALTAGSWADLVRSTGARYALGRLRSERAWRVLGSEWRDAIYREIWSDAATSVGAEMLALSSGFLETRRDGVSTRVWQQFVGLDDAVTLRLALDKPLVHRLLSAERVPVPAHAQMAFSDGLAALDFLARASGPVVVKPASGTGGGGGTTAGVSGAGQLARARMRAARFSPEVLIESQAPGAVYRVLFLDGELIDVLRHHPPRLTGDGRSRIVELIARENERRMAGRGRAGLTPLRVNLDTVLALERAGRRLSSVPPRGTTVVLQTVTNDNRVEDTETVRERLSTDVIDTARTAADAVGLRLAGVDVITADPTRPLAETGGVVTEVNGHPGLHHHYLVADPAHATDVAVPVLERLLEVADEKAQSKRTRGLSA
jgi:cyanophycin synthetase